MKLNLRDGINFLGKATSGRVINAIRVLLSYYISRWTGVARQWGTPIAISVEPTTSCNLRCPECPSGLRSFTRPTGMLQEDLFKKIIDEIEHQLWYLIFYFQGEPYLNPKFLSLVQYAHSKNIYTATSTNAHYLTPELAQKTVLSGLDRLIISIDGTTQEVYEQYRKGGQLNKVIQGSKNIVAAKKELKSNTPHLIFQFLVVKPNEHQIASVKQLAKELGIDEVRFKTAQIYDYENGSELIPTNDNYSRYQKTAEGKYIIKNELANHCWKLWHSCVITWDGNIVPCCFDKDAWYKMGSLQEQSFEQVWKNPIYNEFRSNVLKSRSTIEMCKNCTEGTKVWG